MSGDQSSPSLRFVVLLFIVSIIVLEFPGAKDLIESPYSGIETQNLVVKNIDPNSPNAKTDIRRNDEILSVDGTRVRNYNHLRHLIRQNTDMEAQRYELNREGRSVTADVHYTPVTISKVYRRFTLLLVAFTFLLMGLLVLLRRDDALGVLFSLNCTFLAFFLTDRPVFAAPWLQLAGELLDDAVILFFPAVFLHFFVVFHDRPRSVNAGARLRRRLVIYTLPAVLYVASAVFAVRHFWGLETPRPVVTSLLNVSLFYWLAYLTVSLFIFVRNYRRASVAQKQKKRIAIFGTVVGILPFLSVTVWRQISPGTFTLWEFLAVFSLAFVSMSFAYAILKHGVIELNIVVRRSIAYAFLSGVIIAVYYALVNLAGDFLTSRFHLRPAYFSMVTVLVLAVIFAPARDVVQRVVDRVFFRKDYSYEHEVVEFTRQLARKLKTSEVLDYFVEKTGNLLHPSFIAFYVPDDETGDWVLARTKGAAASLPQVFPKESLLGRYLSRYRKPLMVEYLDYAWGQRNLDDTSTEFLTASRAAVCLPLVSGDAIVALVVFGPKESARLYNQTDSQLLARFGDQLALVLENAELHEASIEQERLKNEVLLAREIQISLLPKSPPQHASLEILGKMVSSEEVGGDYFDYFALEENRIGVGIGDVTGKGVPAAMLMSSLQAVFKGLALRDKMGPGDLVGELNRFLCDTAKEGQFATFFYGIFDLEQSAFSFCNAGHCPGLLLRDTYVDRLGEGGLPLGINREYDYREGRVRIEPQNALCLYTDGITEQSGSHTPDQFGEERLIAFLKSNRNLPLSELHERLFAVVLDHGNGRQDDDITSIIARHQGA